MNSFVFVDAPLIFLGRMTFLAFWMTFSTLLRLTCKAVLKVRVGTAVTAIFECVSIRALFKFLPWLVVLFLVTS